MTDLNKYIGMPKQKKKIVPREQSVVDSITKFLDSLGPECCYEVRHGSQYGKTGQPDISVCYKGTRYEFEAKRDGKHKPTKMQEDRMREWTASGAVCAVVWSKEQVKKIMWVK